MKAEKGFSLIEVVLAIALLGIVAIAFLSALATGSKAIFIADERATAESLARAQMEYVRNQGYSNAYWNYTVTSSELSSTYPPTANWWTNDPPPLLSSDYEGYEVFVEVKKLDEHVFDDGIQSITVAITHLNEEEPIFNLTGYRSYR